MNLFVQLLFISLMAVAQPSVLPIISARNHITAIRIFDIQSFGAIGDGKTVNTQSIQAALDSCYAAGGGTVLISGGRFVTGTLFIKSNTCLRIEAGAVLLGSSSIADYSTNTDRTMYNEPYMDRCLLFARDAENITMEGAGTIDGQGKSLPEKTDAQKNRPKMIRFINCRHIHVRDLVLRNPASWTSEWRNCSDIAVDGITISSRTISNGDGLDFDGCDNVRVSNSAFDTGDDSICLQTSSPEHPCHDITITGCLFSSRWAGIRIGLLSRGDFVNVVVTGCTFRNHNDSGLKIQMLEGGEMRNMVFSNLVMENVPHPVLVTFNKQNAWVDAKGEPAPMKRVHHLLFSNITVFDTTQGKNCSFVVTGMPGHPVENISFSNIHAVFPGGGTAADAQNIPAEYTIENLKGRWPEYGSLRVTVPSYGFYFRHVKGLNVNGCDLHVSSPDERPAIMYDDVTEATTVASPAPVERKAVDKKQ